MQNQLDIRRAKLGDASGISALILNVAHYFSPSPGGKVAVWFLASVTPAAIEGYISDAKYNYLVAQAGEALAGVIALREHSHVHHLFVVPAMQRQGVAARLWERARADALVSGNTGGFSVRSSEYAVPVYQRFGFRVAGARAEKDGLVFVPMRLEPAQRQ